tara:strand:+ start:2158 stop:3150 length:993 start_codon:yes stop_codon:yes gene_type:complete
MKNEKILVTGGCGLIGSNFIIKLLRYKFDIVVIDNLSTGLKKNLDILKKRAKKNKINFFFYKYNLCNKKKLEYIFNNHKFDYIYHFAAYSSVKLSLENPIKVIRNNVDSTKNLIFFTNQFKIKKFVFSSSASIYGNIKFKQSIKETSKLKPINAYGQSKLLSERLIKNKIKKNFSQYCIFRYFNVVGKNISNLVIKKKNLNLFESIYFAIKNKKTFYINGKNLNTIDGTPVRDFVSMHDIVTAHLECIHQKKNKKFWNRIFNVGINKGLSVLQIIKECNKFIKYKIRYKLIENNEGEIEKSIADNSQFLKYSNWKPIFTKSNKIVRSFFL